MSRPGTGSVAVDAIMALRYRQARDETGTYFVEGVRFLVAAIDGGRSIDALVTCPALLVSPIGQMLARRLRQRGVREHRVSREVFRALSTSREPQGVGAVVRRHDEDLFAIRCVAADACFLAIEHVQSPGNLGTLLRTSEAAGATGFIALGPSADPFEPNAVRATMGSLFTRALARASPSKLVAWSRRHGLTIVGASGEAALDYRSAPLAGPVVLALGGERKGLSPAVRAACDVVVRIPMLGRTDSLNLAVAGSLLLYEAFRQRHPTS